MAVSTPNLHSLYHSGLAPGVECKCGRRALVDQAKVGARDGSMIELRFLKLKCLGCGARPTEFRIFSSEAEMCAFEVEADQPRTRF